MGIGIALCATGKRFNRVVPVSKKHFPTPTKRGRYKTLHCGKIEETEARHTSGAALVQLLSG